MRKRSLLSFLRMKKFAPLFLVGLSVIVLLRSKKHISRSLSNTPISRWFSPDINLVCPSWTNSSNLNADQFQECFYADSNDDFWSREGIRHTAFEGLLDSSSLILEIGGNRGHDTMKFNDLYKSSIISYEPLMSMWTSLREKFKTNPKVDIRRFGVGNQSRKLFIERAGDKNIASSMFHTISDPQSSTVEEIQILNAVDVVNDIRKTRPTIDLISMNCEGCEFEILPALIENNMTHHFRIIQFASHSSLLPGGNCIYCQIEQALMRTHRTIYRYNKLWEAWILK